MVLGLNNQTGQTISGTDHLRQSIRDILTTPIGSRVGRREYGSRLFALIDQPITSALKIDITAASAEAIDRWEPRFTLEQLRFEDVAPGALTVGLYGRDENGNPFDLPGIVL
jgi:phage baseplate assembly protein W